MRRNWISAGKRTDEERRRRRLYIGRGFCLAVVLMAPAFLSGCGKDGELDDFYTAMDAFTIQANQDFEALSQLDPASETAVEDLLAAMDQLAASFETLSEIPVPRQFSAMEDLADEASSYMTEAASLYREAYADGQYAENVAEAAQENYDRAVKRMEYISQILQGELPTDASITITTENDAPGFKEDQEEGMEE